MITSSYPRRVDDTSSVFLRYLACGLYKRGIAVHVLAPADDAYGTADEGGIQVTRFRYLPRRWRRLAYGSGMLPNLRRNPLLWLAVPFYLAAMLAKTVVLTYRARPDLVHAHWMLPQGLIAVLATRLTRIPVVVTTHGGDAFALRHAAFVALKRFTLYRAAAWTANTNTTAAAAGMQSHVPAPRVIPMGVDVTRFRAGSRDLRRTELGDEMYLLLFVGRLVDKKGVDDLIRAFAQLSPRLREKTVLWIVGSGERENALRALARDLGAASAVRFFGTVPNEQLPDFYAAADLFIAPSVIAKSGDTEGQGVVFLEAFAAGVPVIAAYAGGIPDVMQHGKNGWLIPPHDPGALAAAIELVLQDKELKSSLVDRASRDVAEKYDWGAIAARFDQLYGEIRRPAR